MPSLFNRISAPQVIERSRAWLEQSTLTRIESLDQLDEWLLPVFTARTPVARDTETNTLDIWRPESAITLVGYSLARSATEACYLPIGHRTGYEKNLSLVDVQRRFELLDRICPTLYYNAAYDLEVESRTGGWEPERFEEVMWACWLYDCDQKEFGLKPVARRILGLDMPSYQEVTEGRNFLDVDPDEATPYGCSDALATWRLWHHAGVTAARLRQQPVYTLERALIRAMRRLMRTGIWWDDALLAGIEDALGGEVKLKNKVVQEAKPGGKVWTLQQRIYAAAGGPLNLDSPEQVGAMLVRLGVPIVERTDTGQVATGDEVLAKYVAQYPLCRDVVNYKKFATFDRGYVRKLRAGIARFGPKLRFPFKQIGAPTGRMSCSGEGKKAQFNFDKGVIPLNLQSIPDPKKESQKPVEEQMPDLRAAVIANAPEIEARYRALQRDGLSPDESDELAMLEAEIFDIVAIDYSQIELRVAGNLSGEPAWIRAFNEGQDIHLTNAQLGYGETFPRYLPDGHEDPRRGLGKTMGFALLFGAVEETVAAHGGITVAAARALLQRFWQNAPRLAEWVETSQARARIEQRVRTWLGRERPLGAFYGSLGVNRKRQQWRIAKGDREAVNDQVQGGAAEVFKMAMVAVDTLLTAKGWHDDCQVLLPMHDELVFRVRRSHKAVITQALQQVMTITVPRHPIPYVTEAETGRNWGGDLHPYQQVTPVPQATAPIRTTVAPPRIPERPPGLPSLAVPTTFTRQRAALTLPEA